MTLAAKHITDVSEREPHSAMPWTRFERFMLGLGWIYFAMVWVPWALITLAGIQWPFAHLLALGQWTITHVFGLPEHSASPLGADHLGNYLAGASAAVISVVVSLGWILTTRTHRDYSTAFAWLHTLVRYTAAAFMLSYGAGKIFPAQFGRMVAGAGVDYLAQQVGQLPPRDLLWAFMEASRQYQVFTGCVEFAGGILLLSRRVAPLGAVLSVAAMTNVWLMDVSYDVSVKFLAGQILLMVIFVLAPYAAALYRSNALIQLLRALQLRPLFAASSSDRYARIAGSGVAVLLVIWSMNNVQTVVADNRAIAQSPLSGIWDVEAAERNGVAVPLVVSDTSIWRRILFPWNGPNAGAIIISMGDALTRCASKIDMAAKVVEFSPLSGVPGVVGSSYGLPKSVCSEREVFRVSSRDADHLELSRFDADGLVLHFRRFDPATYRLLGPKSGWRW